MTNDVGITSIEPAAELAATLDAAEPDPDIVHRVHSLSPVHQRQAHPSVAARLFMVTG